MPWYVWTYFSVGFLLACSVGFVCEQENSTEEPQNWFVSIALFLFWGVIVILIPFLVGKGFCVLYQKRLAKKEEKKTEKIFEKPKYRHSI